MENQEKFIKTLTITTDWLNNDYYYGVLRGRLISICPNLNLIEISNQIPTFNLHHAAFILRHSYKHFPIESIHLVMVNSENNPKQRMLSFKHNDHFFVIPDNGIIGLLFREMPPLVYPFPFSSPGSFSSLNASANAISEICQVNGFGESITPVTDYDQKIPLRATIENSVITGSIIYIDSYFNLITNVSRDLFDRVAKNRRFEIFVQSHYNKVDKLVSTYNEVDDGELLALFNSEGLLEIAINNGYAAQLLSLNVGGSIRIKFYEND